jgi:hypothetical protein
MPSNWTCAVYAVAHCGTPTQSLQRSREGCYQIHSATSCRVRGFSPALVVQVAHCDAAPLYSLRSPISDIGERLAVHGEGETINKEAAKEQDAPSVDGRSTTEQQETTYCRNNKTIDCHLRALHNACARGDENAQIQIDRHLFLCSVKHGMVIGDFAGMDSALCLHEHQVPQYSLLPDLYRCCEVASSILGGVASCTTTCSGTVYRGCESHVHCLRRTSTTVIT